MSCLSHAEPAVTLQAPVRHTERFAERVTRIELAFSAWEADVLPLNYTRTAGEPAESASVAPSSEAPEGGFAMGSDGGGAFRGALRCAFP